MEALIETEDSRFAPYINSYFKKQCIESHLSFTRIFFQARQGIKFRVNWHHHLIADTLQKVIDGELKNVIFNVPPGSSKCVAPETLVFTTDGPKRADKVRPFDMLYSHDNGLICIEPCLATEAARKNSLEISMRSGRSIVVSHDHPMLGLRGYTKAEDFIAGDRIRCIAAEIDSEQEINEDELSFATFMIFEGTCSLPEIRFSGDKNESTSEFLAVCDRLGVRWKQYECNSKYDFNLLGGKDGVAANLLKKFGLLGGNSYTKRIPHNWFSLSLKQKLRVIDIAIATDGYIAKSKGSFGIGLANKGLIEDLQHMLSTCGIVSSWHYHPNNHAGCWVLLVPREDTLKLSEKLTMFHKRKSMNMETKAQSCLRSIPSEAVRGVKGFWYWSKFNGKPGNKKTITQNNFARCVERFPELEYYQNRDFYWDEVVGIKDVGERDLIHLQVNRTRNFIANGLVSHNTEMVGINLMARGLAINPRCRFLYLSYSDDLALVNSYLAKEIIGSDEYQAMWPMEGASDAKSSKRWNIKMNKKQAGGVYATSLGGQITGFRAGHMAEGFQGAIICFPHEETVLTERGMVSIGDIVASRENVRVYSRNMETGEIELRRIEGWHKNPESDIIEVGLSDESTFRCTPYHKIWTDNRGWVEAASLTSLDCIPNFEPTKSLPNSRFIPTRAGNTKTLKANNRNPSFIRYVRHDLFTYCLTVEGNHNFFVGHSQVLSSNCDDPLKIEDSFSKTYRDRANRQLVGTVESRKANPDTPIILIMQRVAEEDPTGFIMKGGLSGEWHHVVIPAIIDDAYVAKLDPKYQAMVDSSERDENGRFSYWPYKEPIKSLCEREKGGEGNSVIARYSFSSQYMQAPTPLGGGIIQGGNFKRYKMLPKLRARKIFADTAQKTAERNDFSVFECWGLGEDGCIYLIDLIRGKWEAHDLKRRAKDFWAKHKLVESLVTSQDAAIADQAKRMGKLQAMMVEDKSSGTGLIQDIRSEGRVPILPIQRSVDKLTRVMDVVSYIDSGHVYIPEEADFVSDFLTECEAFTPDDSHKHDDQIDPMCDAINNFLGSNSGGGIIDYYREQAEALKAQQEAGK
jgi:predicted phage terminase large subunit-like protein